MGGTYLPRWGVPTLDGGGGTYLGWGEEVPTLEGGYLPWRGKGYLPWMGVGYLPWMGEGVPTLDGGRGYLPWMGGGGTYLGWGEGVPTLDGGRGYLPFTGYAAGGMPLAFHAGGLSCSLVVLAELSKPKSQLVHQ